MKDENILVWYKGCSLVLNWCCSHSLWSDILFQFLTSGFKKQKANLKKSLRSDRLSELWSCAQKMPRPPSPSACVSEDRAGCAPGWWRAVQYAPRWVGMVPRELFPKVCVAVGYFRVISSTDAWLLAAACTCGVWGGNRNASAFACHSNSWFAFVW